MATLDLIFSRKAVQTVGDYADIINKLLNMDIVFTVMKFSGTEQGIEMRISVPDEKVKDSIDILSKTDGIIIRRSVIEADEEKWSIATMYIHNTGVLDFDKDYRRYADKSKGMLFYRRLSATGIELSLQKT